MLLGRTEERLALDRLLAEARAAQRRAGAGRRAGIGKTALLDYAAQQARPGCACCGPAGSSRKRVPFAGLAELLRPCWRIAGSRGLRLLRSRARWRSGPAADDRFAVGAATLSLLSANAEDGPLVLLLDDAHWLDGSSARRSGSRSGVWLPIRSRW